MNPSTQHRFERGMAGEPQTYGNYIIQPLARLSGRSWDAPEGFGGGAFVRIIPTEVVVRDENGVESVLEIKGAGQAPWRGMLIGALSLAALCLVIMAWARRLR